MELGQREEVRDSGFAENEDPEGMPLGRGSPEWSRGPHLPPGTNSGSGLVSPVARGIPLRSSLVTHLSVKGSVGRRGEGEEWDLPRQKEGPFRMDAHTRSPGRRDQWLRIGEELLWVSRARTWSWLE